MCELVAFHRGYASEICSTPERAWRAAAVDCGPYSPIPGPTSISFCGGKAALAHQLRVDTSPLSPDADISPVVELKDDLGRSWYVRNEDGLCRAFRDRNDEEIIKYMHAGAERSHQMFPSRGLVAVHNLALEIFWAASAMCPDKHMARSKRREIKKRLIALADLQMDLLTRKVCKSQDIDQRMAELVALWHPLNPVRELDRELR